jgi:hypothetical protein
VRDKSISDRSFLASRRPLALFLKGKEEKVELGEKKVSSSPRWIRGKRAGEARREECRAGNRGGDQRDRTLKLSPVHSSRFHASNASND